MGGFFAASTLFNTPEGQPTPPFLGLLAWNFVAWYLWAALFPVIQELARQYPLESAFVRNLPKHIVGGITLMAVHVLVFVSIQWLIQSEPATRMSTFGEMLQSYVRALFDTQVTVYLLVLAAAHMINYYKRFKSEELRSATLRSQLAELQLQALRMQLNPHFLFNTLNAITELIHSSPDKAERMVVNLSELLRTTLATADEQRIPLEKELEFIEQYLAIQKMRFGDRLKIERRVAPELLNAYVPNMIIQPIVENSLIHGIGPLAQGGAVSIEAQRMDHMLRISVRDTGKGLPDSHDLYKGIGLRNTRDRLSQLYGSRQRLTVEPQADRGVCVTIELPFEEH